MKPLNFIIHLKSNMKRIFPTILTLALEFAALTFLISIGIGEIDAGKYNLYYGIDNMIEITLPEDINSKELSEYKEKISKIDNVKLVTNGYYENATAMLPLMYTGTSFFTLDAEDLPKFIENTELNIVEGRLPENADEIAVTREALNISNAKLNDMIGVNYDNKLQLSNDYKIVGIVEGKNSCYLSASDTGKHKNKLLIQTTYDNKSQVVEDLNSLGITEIIDFLDVEDFIDNIKSVLVRLGILVIGIFSIVILITVINLSKSLISNFQEEYSLLYALGYEFKTVKKRVKKQLLFILLSSSIIGVLLGIMVNILFDKLYCVPKGIYYTEFSIYMFIPLIVGILLFYLSSYSVNKEVEKQISDI